jgi:hypothetical protein
MDVPPGRTPAGPGKAQTDGGQPPWLPRPAAPARQTLIAAFARARDSGDTAGMTAAALRLPSVLEFGAPPGQVPTLIHEAYAAAAGPAGRGRLAAALARAWVYGGGRGVPLRPRSRPPGPLAAQPRGRGRRRSRIRSRVGGPGGKPRTRCWPPGASGNPAARVGS